ncbi:MAG: choice-of-anchor J domain-containing protein [Xanthomarina gelatinilytica]|uniref:choice-of-anchor J domain-containing protein n=1 Tax=Xanthomarina gelatinilytica TaxID=1137281 RepID=UPI003A83CA41
MRNKLQTAVATNPLFSSRDLNELKLKSNKKNSLNKHLVYLFSFMALLLFSSKSFAQLNETFDSGIPATWTLFGNTNANIDWSTTTDGYLGTNGVSVNPSADNIGDQNTAQYFLVSPQVTAPNDGEIQFYTKQASEIDNGATYEVRVSTATQPDINGFNVTLASYTEANLNLDSQTEYEKKVVTLPEGTPAGLPLYIAFVVTNTQNGAAATGDEWFVDQFRVVEGCPGINDADVTVDDISVTGAEITWSHVSATNFEIQAIPQGGDPADVGIPVSGNSYTLSDLDPDTGYDIYIAALCDNDTKSDWIGPVTFETLRYGLSCEYPIVVPDVSSTPYVLADNLANFSNPNLSYSTQGTNCISGSSTQNHLRGDKIFLSYTPTTDGLLTLSQTTFDGGDSSNNCWNARSSLLVYDTCADVGVACLEGTNTVDGFEPAVISNMLVEAGEEYMIVVSSELVTGSGICFELEISSPSCAPPSVITFNSLTQDSVEFSWDNIGGFASSWEYVVVPAGSGEPTGSGTSTATNVENLINSGLTFGTAYDFYVRSLCGGTPGIWSDPVPFTTQCPVFDVPYSTSFTDATNENPEPCWTTIDANGDGIAWSFIGGYATVQTLTSQGENHDLYISPQINFDGVQKRLRYKHRATQGISSYSVKISTTGAGVDNFTTVIVPETQISNIGFEEVTIDIPVDIVGDVNIAWIVEPNDEETAFRVSIDDIVVENKPTCPVPTNPFTLNVTQNSAWLFWSQGENENQWELVIQDLNSGEPTGSGELVSQNAPYMATGLEPGTRYEFYVRAYCEADDQSEWVGPVPFTTLCTSYDTPFVESFNDDDDDTQKFCWDTSNGGWYITETTAKLDATGSNNYLISPAINIDGAKELKFKYRAETLFFLGAITPPRFGVEVLMSTTNDNPASFNTVVVPGETFTHSSYIEKSAIIEGNGTIYIAFRVPSNFSGHSSRLNIDDVSITDAPPCPMPFNAALDTVTSSGAEFSWEAGYQETSWNVVVQEAGMHAPTEGGESVSENNYEASGLEPNTAYEFYIQSNCDANGVSEWFGPIPFQTTCVAYTAPFTETFDSDSETDSCWVVVDGNSDTETWDTNNSNFVYEGDQAAAAFTGTNGQNNDWLISPTITIADNHRLRFYYRALSQYYVEDMRVVLSTNGTGLNQFTTELYHSDDDPVTINNEEYRVKIVDLQDITGDVNIAIHVPQVSSSGPSRGNGLLIDNFIIEEEPNCTEITNISVDMNTLTDTTMELSWDENGSTQPWQISVQPAGTPAPEGDTQPEYLYTANTNPFTVTGLTASTMYDVYVRAQCGEDYSPWSEPLQVTTRCPLDNQCEYRLVLRSDWDVSAELQLTQNNQTVQAFPFDGNDEEGDEYYIYLCNGVEFSLYFWTVGSNAPQYAAYQFDIFDSENNLVYSSPTGLEPRRVVYSGMATCGPITCPQPTDLTSSETTTLSWTPAGTESQWEVAVQPVGNGTVPHSGNIVSSPSYTPTDADYNDLSVATYEYFVRAICSDDEQSYWSGPYVFVRNDDSSTALTLPVNASDACEESVAGVSFLNASVSPETMSCEGVNQRDVWFNFTAESEAHILKIKGFDGNFYHTSGDMPYPAMTMTLYQDNGGGDLVEMACTYDNILIAMYSNELVVGQNYKLRLTLNSDHEHFRRFNVCLTTPSDPCEMNLAINGGFEDPVSSEFRIIQNISSLEPIPGWRQNLTSNNSLMFWLSLNGAGFYPYEGGQCVQIRTEDDPVDINDPDVRGLFRDFDTSEATLIEFSFAHLARFEGNNLQLYAGSPDGPYELITENIGGWDWETVSGTYQIPDGQNQTRFIFRAGAGVTDVGNLLDDVQVRFNNEIITEPFEVDCNSATALVEANGKGTWLPSDANPGSVTIADANSNSTTISDFVVPGTYIFTWETSYCSYDIELTYNGVGETPTVESPVEYCLNDTAEALSAPASGTYTVTWFTQAEGGTGSTTAPIPDTSTVGTTSYYVAYVAENGCEGPRAEIQVEVSESFTPELTFSYDTTCSNAENSPMPILVDGFETGGTFSSATLTVDTSTGEIDLSSATVGSHDVTYTFDGDAETCTSSGTYTASIEFIQGVDSVTEFSYDASYCANSTNPLPTLETGFTAGGTFSSTTLTVDANTGEIDLSSATAGSHDVTYAFDGDADNCIGEDTYTTSIEVVAVITPTTEFAYNQGTYCANSDNPLPTLETGFTTGGAFSSTTLTVDANTGEVDLSSATAGSHDITYTFDADTATCTEAGSYTASIVVVDIVTPTLSFTYDGNPYCNLGTNPMPSLAAGFATGGTFSSTTLTVDASSGEVDLSSATTGSHDITYTFDGDTTTCEEAGTFTASIEVIASTATVTGFTYEEDLYCADGGTVLPLLDTGFTTGGTFTAENGLSINATTGEINISSSTVGNYTIVYEIVEDVTNCTEGSVSTFDITVLDDIEVAINGDCEDSDYVLTASPVGGSFDESEASFIWMDANGNTIGDNSETFNVTAYASSNDLNLPTHISVEIMFGGCSSTASFMVERSACKEIPRGISPDGNGKNDTFDLSGYGVVQLSIFNRNGREVYSFSGNYGNQWHGQSNNDKELPDGTYFYAIKKDDGSKLTGWIFINRAH